MKNKIEFTEDELDFLLRLYHSSEIKGAYKINNNASLDEELLQNLMNKEILVLDKENKLTLESFVELVLLTTVHPDFILTCNIETAGFINIFNIYIHSETIVIVQKSLKTNIFSFLWVPTLQLAIGGLTEYYEDVPMNGQVLDIMSLDTKNDVRTMNEIEAIHYIRSRGNKAINKILDEVDLKNISVITGISVQDDISNEELKLMLFKCNGNYYQVNIALQKVYFQSINKVHLIQTITKWLAYSYSSSLRKVVN